jgi:colanic acid/amylovoran biosynthesis glycosyltransferase
MSAAAPNEQGRLAYITAQTPYGKEETFVLAEMLSLKESGADLLIAPRDRPTELFHKRGEKLAKHTLALPLLNLPILGEFIRQIFRRPLFFARLIQKIALQARTPEIAIKNIIVLPKALYLSRIFTLRSIAHIHTHWASTTATMAYVISSATGIPWSFTAHRWDIAENNILKTKVISANFVRAINEAGKNEILNLIGDEGLAKKIHVVHMGVPVPGIRGTSRERNQPFSIICPAHFLPVKGHRYLVEACVSIVKEKGGSLRCLLAGDGPLEKALKELICRMEAYRYIHFLGRLPHEELLELYRTGRIDAVVLPSIVTAEGEKEGIPVALMEAMSYGIPVISTKTGGISELLGEGGGILVEQKDPAALAEALEMLISNTEYFTTVANRGRQRILKDFDLSLISEKLLTLFFHQKRDLDCSASNETMGRRQEQSLRSGASEPDLRSSWRGICR